MRFQKRFIWRAKLTYFLTLIEILPPNVSDAVSVPREGIICSAFVIKEFVAKTFFGVTEEVGSAEFSP